MEMQDVINLVPAPIALGMVLYTNYKLKDHEKNCSVRDLIVHIKEKQSDIDGKINLILEKLIKD